MTPEPLKRFRPLVKRTDRLRVRSIKHPPPVAPHVDQAHLEQHPQVLRYRRLLQPQQIHNLPYRPLLQRQIAQDRPPPRLRHGIKRIRSCRRPCHELNNTFPYGNMSSTIFPPYPVPLPPRRTASTSWFHPGEKAPTGRLFSEFGSLAQIQIGV